MHESILLKSPFINSLLTSNFLIHQFLEKANVNTILTKLCLTLGEKSIKIINILHLVISFFRTSRHILFKNTTWFCFHLYNHLFPITSVSSIIETSSHRLFLTKVSCSTCITFLYSWTFLAWALLLGSGSRLCEKVKALGWWRPTLERVSIEWTLDGLGRL